METPFTIDLSNGGKYYALFYFFAFLVGLIVLMAEGTKRKFVFVPWLLVIATAFLFFMLGTQAIRFSGSDWSDVLHYRAIAHNSGRSVLGGILFSIPALLIAKYFLKFRSNVMDSFAWVAPVGMIIQRFGCLLASCCFGTVTDLPWGVRYGVSSHVFDQHLQSGMVDANSAFSLAVHPVQLYEVTGCVIILLLLFLIQKWIRIPGNLFIAFLGLYATVRFCTEFFRATSFGASHTDGLTMVQRVILAVVPVILAVIILREKKGHSIAPAPASTNTSERQWLFYFLSLTIVFLIASRWLNLLEIVTLNLVMIPAFLMMGWQVFKSVTVPNMRFTTVCLIAGSLLMMSQTLPETSSSDSTRFSYNVFSVGIMGGNSDFLIENQDCSGGPSTTNRIKNNFKAYAAGIGRVQQLKKGIIQYGLDGYWGDHRETVDGNQTRDIPVIGFHPYVQYDLDIIGFGVGLHVGTFTQSYQQNYDATTNMPTSFEKLSVYPSAYFRVGYLAHFFGEVKLAQQFPTPFPSLGYQTNLGIGFGNHGGAVRLGTASYAGIIIAPIIPVGKHIIVEPYVGVMPGLFPTIYSAGGTNYQESSLLGSLSIRYKFARNEKAFVAEK